MQSTLNALTDMNWSQVIPKELSLSAVMETARNFEFQVGVTPLSDPVIPLTCSVAYLVVVWLSHALMSYREKPLSIGKPLAIANNMWMSFFSFVMLVGMVFGFVEQANAVAWDPKILLCDPEQTVVNKGTLHFVVYLFYLSKIYELLDTLLLVIKKSTLTFLHVYHHAFTLLLVYFGLYYGSPVQFIQMLNAAVHVPMYYYFALIDQGHKPWWKKYITTIQLIQFVLILSAIGTSFYFTYGLGYACSSFDSWNNEVDLVGIGSYLVLFGMLYVDRYMNNKKGGKKDAKDGKKETKKSK